jgi:hypothetical protein
MTNLSKREKFLIFLMGVILPIALITALLIIPTQNKIQENQAQLSLLEIQKAEVETKISLMPTFTAKKEDRLLQVDESINQIASPLHAAEFERWMLPLFSKYEVPVYNVSLSETKVAIPDIMITNLEKPVYRILELINDYNEIVVEEDTAPVSTTQLLSAYHTYEFNATLSRYMSILDEIKNWDTSFFVVDSSYNAADYLGSITIAVYSVHKIDDDVLGIYDGDYGVHPNESVSPSLPKIPK